MLPLARALGAQLRMGDGGNFWDVVFWPDIETAKNTERFKDGKGRAPKTKALIDRRTPVECTGAMIDSRISHLPSCLDDQGGMHRCLGQVATAAVFSGPEMDVSTKCVRALRRRALPVRHL
jgi:hypothetical protein